MDEIKSDVKLWFLLRCGGTLVFPYHESNCRNTVAIPTRLLTLGMVGLAEEIERIERWVFSDCPQDDGTRLLQPMCPTCAATSKAGGPG